MTAGMDRKTGNAVSGDDWIAQAVAEILLTPLGTRVMRRDFGSRLPELIDAPLGPATALQIYAATASALRRWLPQLRLTRALLEKTDGGTATLHLEGRRADLAGNPATSLALALPLTA